jgi:hypothetical protein
MKLADIEGMSPGELAEQVGQGGRLVVYEYCISVILMSFRRSSAVFFIPPGSGALTSGLAYTLCSLLLGWWGIPWGPLWTIRSLVVNCSGGKDVTEVVMGRLRGDPAYFEDFGRSVKCRSCGHDNSTSRMTCKNCRAPLNGPQG